MLGIEKKMEEQQTLENGEAAGGASLRVRDTRNVRRIEKNYFFQLANDFYDVSLKINTKNECVILPSVKHELLRRLLLEPDELEGVKEIFVQYSTKHRGIDFDSFEDLVEEIFGIYQYPFVKPLFNYFDKKNDGLIDFIEFAESMNVLYKGDPILKSRYIFELIDFHKMKDIGIRELNKVFELAYIDVFIDIKTVYNYFALLKTNRDKINMKDLFNNKSIIDKMHRTIDIVLDRNERLKLYITVLETVHGFDIFKLQKMWELYKMYYIKNYDMIKSNLLKKDDEAANIETVLLQNLYRSHDFHADEEPSPFELTAQQFKIIMRELFSVQDVQLLDEMFGLICGKKYSKCLLEKFFESVTYYFNCKFELKVALVFEVYCVVRNTSDVPYDCVIDFVSGLFETYWHYYKEAKKFVDKILDEKDIKFMNYKNLEAMCFDDPSKLDCIFRFTLGKYKDQDSTKKTSSALYLEYKNETEGNETKSKIKNDKNMAIGYKNWNAK